MIGTTNSFGSGNTSFYVIKTDSLCNHEWSKTYGGSQNQGGFSVANTFDKGYVFLGFTDSYGAGGYDVYLVKTDSMGNFQWQKTYGGSDWDFGYSIQQLPDSGFVMCGLTYSYGSGNGNVYVIRTDKNGDTLWTRAIGGSGYYSVGNSVCVYQDSLYFIAGGNTKFGDGDTNVFIAELNDKGILKWDTTFYCKHSNAANSIRNTLDKGFLIYGYTDSIPNSIDSEQSQMMIKMDSLRKVQWIQIYYNTVIGTGKDAIETQNGYYLSVGTLYDGSYFGHLMNIQYYSSPGWFADGLNFVGGLGYELGNSIAYRNRNNFAVAGATTYGIGNWNFYVVRFTYDSLAPTYKLSQHNFTDTLSPASVLNINKSIIGVKIFPNPMTSSATVLVQGINGQHYLFSLFDETGKSVIQDIPTGQVGHGQSKIVISRNNLRTGIYIYEVTDTNNNKVATGKILVE